MLKFPEDMQHLDKAVKYVSIHTVSLLVNHNKEGRPRRVLRAIFQYYSRPKYRYKKPCFHDYAQEIALSFLYYIKNWKKPSPKVIVAKKYELNRHSNGEKSQKLRKDGKFVFLTAFLSRNHI